MTIDGFINAAISKRSSNKVDKRGLYDVLSKAGIKEQSAKQRFKGQRQFTFIELLKLCEILECDMNTLTSALIQIITNY